MLYLNKQTRSRKNNASNMLESPCLRALITEQLNAPLYQLGSPLTRPDKLIAAKKNLQNAQNRNKKSRVLSISLSKAFLDLMVSSSVSDAWQES